MIESASAVETITAGVMKENEENKTGGTIRKNNHSKVRALHQIDMTNDKSNWELIEILSGKRCRRNRE